MKLPILNEYGYRMKIRAKSSDLSKRWCSAYLKICVADAVVSNLDRLGELEKLGETFKISCEKRYTRRMSGKC